jgi:hypothetical protein
VVRNSRLHHRRNIIIESPSFETFDQLNKTFRNKFNQCYHTHLIQHVIDVQVSVLPHGHPQPMHLTEEGVQVSQRQVALQDATTEIREGVTQDMRKRVRDMWVQSPSKLIGAAVEATRSSAVHATECRSSGPGNRTACLESWQGELLRYPCTGRCSEKKVADV